MTDTTWLTDYWVIWLFVIFAPVVYEFWALATGRRTISRMVWTGAKKYPWSVPITLSVLCWLIPHFYITHGEWEIELPVTAVLVAIVWMAYLAWRKKATDAASS